jgi:hypothetical protein
LRAIVRETMARGADGLGVAIPAEEPWLALFTRDAARLQFEEGEKGTLAAGKRADLVVVSGDPLGCAPDRIADLRVVRTVTAGRVVFDAEGRAA